MAKHTPGPWSFVPPVEGTPDMTVLTYVDPHKNPLYIARVYGTGQHGGPVNQERVANARLIAAAPELLDLAKEALSRLARMDFTCSANWNGSLKTNIALLLNAAIAKAEGRE